MNPDSHIPGALTAALFASVLDSAAGRGAPPGWAAIRSGVPKRNKDQAKAARKARKRQRRGW